MYSKVYSMALNGIEGIVIAVETDVATGLPEYDIIGRLSAEVREAKERVRICLKNSGYALSPRRVTVNLSPADIRKAGTAYDLAIAAGILTSYGLLQPEQPESTVLIGELGLDGSLCATRGVISMVMAARDAGFSRAVVPKCNEREAAAVSGIEVYSARTLTETAQILSSREKAEVCRVRESPEEDAAAVYDVDMSEIRGQQLLKRAAEVAAAGMHNLLIVGPPGSGKTMIARRIPTILPELSRQEGLEVTKIYSIRGLLPPDCSLMMTRPFRAPHHTISASALAGGGTVPKPGEISLAHRGVLFLDELPEFSRASLEVLRQPLEDRRVTISRVYGSYSFPSDCMVVAAMNPCPCGYYPDRNRCSCSETAVRAYLGRISRPLIDRMDICTEAPAVGYREISDCSEGEGSEAIRRRVTRAWEIQRERFRDAGIYFNAQMGAAQIRAYCRMTPAASVLMKETFRRMELSARAYHRILKVARTIADLKGREKIGEAEIAEASGYRGLEQKYWG